MITIEKTDVYGFMAATRGLRNPMNSWDKGDSYLDPNADNTEHFVLGDADADLMRRMNVSTEQSKYRRMITVTADITAPLYWWKEFDTYKVGTATNSCSTMHKIHAKKFAPEDFSMEHLINDTDPDDLDGAGPTLTGIDGELCNVNASELMLFTIRLLNEYRDLYLETKDKKYWWQLIQLLPSSYNQKRTVQLNYEVLAQIYRQRKAHKLDEWHIVCDWIKSLPYAKEIITGE